MGLKINDKNDQSVNIIILTGFLGSGKTTFLQQLINFFFEKSIKIAVLMNEFGEIDVDGQLLDEKNYEYKEVVGGSIFCSCKHDQFIDTVLFLLTKNPVFLIIESSGISDPFHFYNDLKIISQQLHSTKIRSINALGIFDGVGFFDLYESTQILKRQIAFSNILFLNKIDLINNDSVEEILQIMHSINKDAKIYRTKFCHLDTGEIETLLSLSLSSEIFLDDQSFEHMKKSNLTKPEEAPERIVLEIKPKDKLKRESPKVGEIISFLQELIPITYRIKGYLSLKEGTVLFNCVHTKLEWNFVENTDQTQGIVVIFKEKIDYLIADSVKKKWIESFCS